MVNMDDVADIESARTACLRSVGRNLVNVQRIELMMKFLLKVNFSTPLVNGESHARKHIERISRKSMGLLISELAETVLMPSDDARATLEIKEVWISTSLNVPMDAEARSAWKKNWEILRTERNKLVHLMLAKVDFDQPDQCQKLSLELDAQNGLFLDGIAFLAPIVTAAQEAIAEMASNIESSIPPLSDAPRK
jgi:hypothetical protein